MTNGKSENDRRTLAFKKYGQTNSDRNTERNQHSL